MSIVGFRNKEHKLNDDTDKIDSIVINEVQLILAEKRTSLAVMRTGIAVLALPLSVMSVLIATSKYYDVLHVLHFLVPLGAFCITLIIFGAYLIINSIIRMRHYDRIIHEIKLKHSLIGEFIE
jgi:uncharacterized membrane protein YidH (DUF202 family)